MLDCVRETMVSHIDNCLRSSGDHSEGVTPVPIPNTAVKPLSGDGTTHYHVWKSSTLPDLK